MFTCWYLLNLVYEGLHCFLLFFPQINEEVVEKILEINQKYSEVRKPIYDKREDIIKSIPDFWLTAVSNLSKLVSDFLFTSSNPLFPSPTKKKTYPPIFTAEFSTQHNLSNWVTYVLFLCSLWVILIFVNCWMKKTERLAITFLLVYISTESCTFDLANYGYIISSISFPRSSF